MMLNEVDWYQILDRTAKIIKAIKNKNLEDIRPYWNEKV